MKLLTRCQIVRGFLAVLTALSLFGLIGVLPGEADRSGDVQVAYAASDPVIAAAGDIACDPASSSFNGGNGVATRCRQKYTSDLLVNGGFAAVLPLGDNQYECGGYQAFLQSYDLSWGRVKSITHPVVGNHEYLTTGGTDCGNSAAGYFQYFGAAAGNPSQGYYSYDIGTWHIIAINSNCSDAGGCGSTSPQGQWLQADLNAHTNFCTLAYWHIPLFSSGGRAAANTQWIWQTLYDHNADLILSGHDHIYERFAPQTSNGTLDTVRGIREFIVGSGGANHTLIASIAANSEVRNTDTFGVLKLTLHPTSYDWQFIPEAGGTFSDSGTTACHGSGPTPTPGPTSTPTQTRTPTSTVAGGTSYTFAPVADTYVQSDTPNTNYGSAAQFIVDNSPVENSLLKFTVSGIGTQKVLSAKLRIYCQNGSAVGGTFYRVADNTWTEASVTWNNAPISDPNSLAALGAVAANNWYEVDLTSLITGDGTFSLKGISTSSDGAYYASKEGTAGFAPQLVVTVISGGTATLTPTATPTSTPTNTPTALATATQTATPSHTATPTNTMTPAASFTPTGTFTPTTTFTSTNTATATATQTSIPTATSTATPTNTLLPTDTFTPTATPIPIVDPIFADGFETGDLSIWSSSVSDAGDLSVSPSAALAGSNGLQTVINDNNANYVSDNTPNAEPRYRARFYFDPNSIVMADRDAFYLLYGYSGTSTGVLRVELRMFKLHYQVRAALRNDSNGWTNSSWLNIADAPHWIELDWQAAAVAGANNGSLSLWIDGEINGAPSASVSGIDNDTRRIDQIQFGVESGIDAGTRGTLYFDAFESRRQSYIGP